MAIRSHYLGKIERRRDVDEVLMGGEEGEDGRMVWGTLVTILDGAL